MSDEKLAQKLADLADISREVAAVSARMGTALDLLRQEVPIEGAVSYVDTRRVWRFDVAQDEYGFGPLQIMVEVFGDGDPTVALRPSSAAVWCAPIRHTVL